jgi:hypothetical protein
VAAPTTLSTPVAAARPVAPIAGRVVALARSADAGWLALLAAFCAVLLRQTLLRGGAMVGFDLLK